MMEKTKGLEQMLVAAREVSRRLSDSADELRTILPVTGTSLAHMPEKFRTEVDALLHRFRTLHGLLTGRIVPEILDQRGLESRGKLPAELAALLFAQGLVADAERFAALTHLRDQLRDAFPVDANDEAAMVNICAGFIPDLATLLRRIEGQRV